MEPASPSQTVLVVAICIAFPIVFGAFWSLICGLLAVVSGYRPLLDFRIERSELDRDVLLPTPWFAMIGGASYRGGVLSLGASEAGLTLRVMRLFPFHPPIRVPWSKVQPTTAGAILGRFGAEAFLLDGRVKLRVPKNVADAIKERASA